MKTKINLHTYRGRNGRLDVCQLNNRFVGQISAESSTYSSKVKGTREANTEEMVNSVYSGNHDQACNMLRAIRLNDRKRLDQTCIEHLANFVATAWETDRQKKVDGLVDLMNDLLDTTGISQNIPLDEALRTFCHSTSATPTVCPSFTLLMAMSYIERLKKRYSTIKGTDGCSYRLVKTAYVIAAKYLHANLRLIVDCAVAQQPHHLTRPILPQLIPTLLSGQTTVQKAHQASKYSFPHPLSPPPSPSACPREATDPLHYHYFQKKESPQQHMKQNRQSMEPGTQFLRMENEFLHFLCLDLSLTNATRLVQWAQQSVPKAGLSPA